MDVRIHQARQQRPSLARDFLSPWRYGDAGTADRGDLALADHHRLALGNGLAVEHTDVADDVGRVPGLRWKQRSRGDEQDEGQHRVV